MFARKKVGALPTTAFLLTEEAGETFNHDLQSYKTDYFVSRAMYAPFGAAVNCVPPTDAARAAALIRRLPTYGRVLICRLSAIEPPSGGTRSRGHPAHVRGCATLTTLSAMKNRRHPSNHTRHSAEPPKDAACGTAAAAPAPITVTARRMAAVRARAAVPSLYLT